MKSYVAKVEDIKRKWYVVDAKDQVLGRFLGLDAVSHVHVGQRDGREDRRPLGVVPLVAPRVDQGLGPWGQGPTITLLLPLLLLLFNRKSKIVNRKSHPLRVAAKHIPMHIGTAPDKRWPPATITPGRATCGHCRASGERRHRR